ncbi:uncharacterized protein L201_005575 [Kwoniella dendrophila CBS 6074]|uniref:Ras-GAP domain-containing protein n=1 Tax=Kwoniella dendrophila CBS 6074 TaxID=1295534 RepID=A0AAX4K0I6_9TREE
MPSVFQAEINYCLTTYDALPPTQNDWETSKKKRASSALSLLQLRPKSSSGGSRNAFIAPESTVKPLASYPIPPPPSFDSNGKESVQWDGDGFDTQRATLRHARSIPQLPPLSGTRESQKRTGTLTNKWRRAVIVIHLHGDGGQQGGGLTIYDNDEIAFRQVLRPIPEINWLNDDVQKVDPSVYAKPHVLSLHLSEYLAIEGRVNNNDNSRKSISTGSRPLKSQNSTFSKFGKRARGYTVTTKTEQLGNSKIKPIEDQSNLNLDTDAVDYDNEENIILDSSTSASPMPSRERDSSSDKILLLEFLTEKEKFEWFVLLRSFGGTLLPRLHRRLEIKVLDLQENIPFSNLSLNGYGQVNSKPGEVGSFDQLSIRSKSEYSNHNHNISSTKVSFLQDKNNDYKPGWAAKDKLKVEIYTDKIMIGQTTWAQAEERSESPFWAEVFNFENMREFSTCRLKIYKLRSGKTPQHFATVNLPLVSAMLKVKDERYPIISLTGQVIGEIRLNIIYRSVNIIGGENYTLPEVYYGRGGNQITYYLMAKGLLDQCVDMYTRFYWALGLIFPRITEMSQIEAKVSGDVLFRSNTPLTRLLEATMRLICSDFLRLSIGPTINYILENEIEVHNESTKSMNKLLDDCWNDMYTQRGVFPNVLRKIFATLFKEVKENHAERTMWYKSVSSFLFLRLIGPALMRPNLFGLSRGLPKSSVQKTLTLIAKIFHSTAFFTISDTIKDPEIARFSSFIRNNNDTMIDYLASFATPLDDFQAKPAPPSNIAEFLKVRVPLLPPEIAQGVPMLTDLIPVEIDADAAVFYELLYQRRKAKVGGAEMTREDGVVPGEEEEMIDLCRTMDVFVSGIHNKSHEHELGDNSSSILSYPREAAYFQEKGKEKEREAKLSAPRASLQIDINSAQRDRKSDLLSVRPNSHINLTEEHAETLDFVKMSKQGKRIVSTSSSSNIPTSSSSKDSSGGGLRPGNVVRLLGLGWMSPTYRPSEWGPSDMSSNQHQSYHGYVHGDNPETK